MAVESAGINLNVRSEAIQRAYSSYIADRYLVNRRYQRKLVWDVEEKQRLIDSIVLALPLPLFLVAEIGSASDGTLEVIDGMQRLNAIFAFVEQEFDYNGSYFDLETLADTKLRLDAGELSQKSPVMSRAYSVRLANYSLAFSVFRAPDESAIDEVFRRINSGGRRLSRQELRQAGTLSPLADLVRKTASAVRGDTSPEDVVPLRKMPILSISNRKLPYGLEVSKIFWVAQNILRRIDVRESLDEQTILDILIDALVKPMLSSTGDVRDVHYSFTADSIETETSEANAIANAIAIQGAEQLEKQFLSVYDTLRGALDEGQEPFTKLIGLPPSGRGGRYFHAVFIAIWELMFTDGKKMRPKSSLALHSALKGISSSASTTSGGDWAAEYKRATIDSFKGRLDDAMASYQGGDDLGTMPLTSKLETVLANAIVEQQNFEAKQGLVTLTDSDRVFDEKCFTRVIKTIAAMANIGPNATGYIAIGVADNESDSKKVKQVDKVEAVFARKFAIVGIEREAIVLGFDLNSYWSTVIQKIRDNSSLPKALRTEVAAGARLIPYQGKAVGLLTVRSQGQPVFFDKELYDRHGSSTVLVPPGPEQLAVYKRFN